MEETENMIDTDEQVEESYEVNTNLNSAIGLYWDNGRNYSNVTPHDIQQWLWNPMLYDQEIRMISRFLYNSNGIYTNVIDYMTSLPTLDQVLFGDNKNHARYQENKAKFKDALRIMRHKQISRDIIRKCAIDGVYFGYMETTEVPDNIQFLDQLDVWNIYTLNSKELPNLSDKPNKKQPNFNCSIFPLPTDWCRIVGIRNSSYVIAFDLFYFDSLTSNGRALKLKKYPKEIREKYKEYRSDLSNSKRYAVLDYNKTIAIKIRANREERTGRPLGLAAFIDMVFERYFIDTKRATIDEINSSVIYQTFPEGESKGQSSLTQKQQKEQHGNVKNALFARNGKRGINFLSIAAGTKIEKLDVDTHLLTAGLEDELIKRISTDLGFAGSALNGEGGTYSTTTSNIELVASEVMEWLEQVVDELNKVVNFNIIKDPQCYIQLYYLPTTIANRDAMVGYMKDLYTLGRGSLQAWIASTGISPEAYIALMDEELADNFDEKYPVHQTAFQQSPDPNAKPIGKPEIKNPTNPNTIKSKTTRDQSKKVT